MENFENQKEYNCEWIETHFICIIYDIQKIISHLWGMLENQSIILNLGEKESVQLSVTA